MLRTLRSKATHSLRLRVETAIMYARTTVADRDLPATLRSWCGSMAVGEQGQQGQLVWEHGSWGAGVTHQCTSRHCLCRRTLWIYVKRSSKRECLANMSAAYVRWFTHVLLGIVLAVNLPVRHGRLTSEAEHDWHSQTSCTDQRSKQIVRV